MSRLPVNATEVVIPELRAEARLREYEQRLAALERGAFTIQTLTFTNAAGPWSLGSFDGESILGVRINMWGRLAWTGAQPVFYLQPNGLSSITAQSVVHRHYYSVSTYGHDVLGTSGAGSLPGLQVGGADWGVTGNTYSMEAVLYTKATANGLRHCESRYGNRDDVTDGTRILHGICHSVWHSSTAPVASLAIVASGGSAHTFTGRITTETF